MHGLDEIDLQPQNNPNQHTDYDADVHMEATQRNDDADALADDVQNPYEADGYHPLNFEPNSFGDDDEDEDDGSDDDGWTKAVDDGDDDVRLFIFKLINLSQDSRLYAHSLRPSCRRLKMSHRDTRWIGTFYGKCGTSPDRPN